MQVVEGRGSSFEEALIMLREELKKVGPPAIASLRKVGEQ
jgi:hypothetical protein